MNPRISVLMPVFNAGPFLGEAVGSILGQAYTDFEIVIVDDCSTDDGPSYLRSLQDRRVRVLRNERNLGVTASLNRGLRECKGELIARMDADDVAEPDRLQRQAAAFGEHPEDAVVGTQTTLIDAQGVRIGTESYPQTYAEIRASIFVHNPFAHSAVMMRRSVILDAGGYDPRFLHNEDYDLWLRVGARHPMRNLADRLMRRRIHDTNITVARRTELTGYRLKTLHHAVRTYYQNPLLYMYLLRPAAAYAVRRAAGVFGGR